MLKELEALQFKEAAKAVRQQVAMEMKKAAKKRRGKAAKGPAEDSECSEDDTTESEESSSSEEESSDEESSEEEESSSEEASSSEEESESDDDDEPEAKVLPKRRPFPRKGVSFSDDDNDVRLLSPRKGTKESLFYSRQEIERFRIDERLRKTEEANANLAALIAAANITVGATN